MTRQVTIKDIADKLGVSTTLVSIVLSGKGREKRFSEETIESVHRTAAEMGYRPNKQARFLRTRKSGLLALIVPDISNPFYGRMARYLEEVAYDQGYQLLIGSFDEENEKFEQLIDRFIGMNIEGFIIVPAYNSDNVIRQIEKLSIPYIFIDRYLKEKEANYIVSDNKAAAMSLVQALITQGASHIAAICYSSDSTAHADRISGYEQALKQNALPFTKEHIYTFKQDFEQESMWEVIRQVHKNQMDGIFFTNNSLGVAGLKVLSHQDCKIPEDIKVACFDYSDAFQLFHGGIWCAEQDLSSICSASFRNLIRMINDEQVDIKQYVPVRLISPKSLPLE
jgi:LacI family transcriptional regulator